MPKHTRNRPKNTQTVRGSSSKILVESPHGVDRSLHLVLSLIFTTLRYTSVFLLGAIAALILMLLSVGSLYGRLIARYSLTQPSHLAHTLLSSRSHDTALSDGRKNIFILGTDTLANRDTLAVRTDTILIASLGVPAGDLKLLSLPRDLWIASQSAKINALYAREQQEQRLLLAPIVGEITGLTIHHQIVIDMQTVAAVVDALGGLRVEVERSFVDTRFPRTDVDVRVVRDPSALYETVAFTQGVEQMSGDRVLAYIRSRHSADPIEGSDDGRVRRQQRVFDALIQAIDPMVLWREPETIGKLLGIYTSLYAQALPLEEIGSVLWQLMGNTKQLQVHSYQLPVEGVSSTPLLRHPEYFPGGAWVYVPIDPSWAETKKTIQEWIVE